MRGFLDSPRAASNRELLRGALPAIYRDDDLAMRFVGALEELLDPIVAILDALPQHFDPAYAPRDMLDLLAAWVGVELDETQSPPQRREVLRRAAGLGRRRGTARGLEEALALFFPALPLRIEDSGGVSWGGPEPRARDPEAPSFVVYCDAPQADETLLALGRTIDRLKPVHAGWRLRVKPQPPPPP